MHQPDVGKEFDFLEDVFGEKAIEVVSFRVGGVGSICRRQPTLAWLVRLWMVTAVALGAGPSYTPMLIADKARRLA